MCVECLIGKQKKPILFKVTEPSLGRFGAFWGVFGAFWGVFGRFGAFFGRFWALDDAVQKMRPLFLTHHELENFSQVETLVLGHLNRI